MHKAIVNWMIDYNQFIGYTGLVIGVLPLLVHVQKRFFPTTY